MGAWGTGPFENDPAADLIASLTKHVDLAVSRKTDATASYHYEAARAVVPFLIQAHATDILGGSGLEPSLRALARMRMDNVWLSAWRNPKKIAAVLDREIDLVLARMATCAYCKRTLPRRGIHAKNLRALAETAQNHRVPKSRRPWTSAQRKRRAALLLRRRADGVLVLGTGKPPHEKAARVTRLPKKKARAGRRKGS